MDQPLVRHLDSARPEVRNFAYRVFFSYPFHLNPLAFGQTPGAFGQQQPQQQQPQQQPANPMFGGFGTNPGTTQTTGFGTTGGWPQDPTHQSISYLPSFQRAERSVRIPQVRQACLVPPNLPLVLVQLERLVPPGLGPQLLQLPRVHLASRAPALQEVSETPASSVPNHLHLGQVSNPPDPPTACFEALSAGQLDGGNITTGTSNPNYAPFNEKDATNTNLTLAYQSITCMPAYRGYSFEVSLIFP